MVRILFDTALPVCLPPCKGRVCRDFLSVVECKRRASEFHKQTSNCFSPIVLPHHACTASSQKEWIHVDIEWHEIVQSRFCDLRVNVLPMLRILTAMI